MEWKVHVLKNLSKADNTISSFLTPSGAHIEHNDCLLYIYDNEGLKYQYDLGVKGEVQMYLIFETWLLLFNQGCSYLAQSL